MADFILSFLEGAVDEDLLPYLETRLGKQAIFCTNLESESGEPLFRGNQTSEKIIAKWEEDLNTALEEKDFLILPPFFAQIESIAHILRNYLSFSEAKGIYITASLGDCWKRLGLQIPGQPIGLGGVRATWISQSKQRTQDWEKAGFRVVDTTDLYLQEQIEAIFCF
ncbi:hypothetical protein KRX54_04465 [Actinomycetaceae bacterium TAE3-ERU4]|nr:hypothetical protein [Actinomycetaceae bacterium TAE3-ERU4]